ncbi:SGNH/GDSL hydrolase family protein [Nocardiopsis sp. NPDC006938]|uniref:SGNH/GDSL hydrolase family protein n=1 Tax=Nocardiopsis sp. NPDC006938 TaxID=3364337 RepID=UPI0036A9290C
MGIRWTAAVAAALVVAGCSGDDTGEPAATPHHYLSLGDSLTVGVQPDERGRAQETSEGYTDLLYTALRDTDSTLRHERMGCGGEDTTTFVGGGLPRCDDRYEAGSQLDQAEEFLRDNGDAVTLVTLTIGGNNFTGCVNDAGTIDEDCVEDGLERLETEVPVIADRLVEAAGPNTRIVGMTYYNPFLALALVDSPGAARSTRLLDRVNTSLTDSYEAAGIDVADVAEAFDDADTEVPADSTTGLPANLQRVCDLTWMCDTERGPDIHTNPAGARTIAEAFLERVR